MKQLCSQAGAIVTLLDQRKRNGRRCRRAMRQAIPMARWTCHSARPLYESDTVTLELADVELTDGTRIDHHVVRIPFEVVSAVVLDGDRRVLLIWRHRFIVDRWGWDVPAGKVRAAEEPVAAAERAVVEETGFRPRHLAELGWFHPSPGISDQRFGVFLGDTAEKVGEPNENEVDRLEWVPIDRVRDLVRAGEVDGLSLTSLLWVLART